MDLRTLDLKVVGSGLHCPARVGSWERIPFLLRSVGAGPAEQRVGELFSELDAGLIEGVDPIKLAGVGGGDLQKHHQLANVCGIDAVELNGHVGSAACGQRAGGGTLLDVDELAEAVSRQISKLFHVRKTG